MKLLTKEIEKKLPALYSQDGKGEDAIAVVKFFAPWSNWTWYASEASAILSNGREVGLADELLRDVRNARNRRTLSISNNALPAVSQPSNSAEPAGSKSFTRTQSELARRHSTLQRIRVCPDAGAPTRAEERACEACESGPRKEARTVYGPGRDRSPQEREQVRRSSQQLGADAAWPPSASTHAGQQALDEAPPSVVDIVFFGVVCGQERELGYFSLDELEAVRGRFGLKIERDLHWTPRPLRECK